MKFAHSFSLATAISFALIGAPVLAAENDAHQAHHPAADAAAPATTPMPGKSGADMMGMDSQMAAMQEMHGKMMAAKTPAERDALMAEHMKVMQGGMAMMNSMSPGGTRDKKNDMATRHQTMEKRMDMMQTTMQMMMDRLPVAPAK